MAGFPSETRPGRASPTAAAGGFPPGTLLGERYRVVALVGRGGMGEVYRADDLRLGQAVALKFLPPGLEGQPQARERLLDEVRRARTVSHPNVCRVYDVGEADGRSFLTMEYIDGEDLASLLRRIGRLPPAKALEVARQLCAGLAAAHDRGVLHRDLKPANVMIDGRGQARITDFGLAAELEPAGPGGDPMVADVAGTLAYMAPERFEGRPATVQSDLYALGLVLYEAFAGRHPLNADTFDGWRRAHSDSMPGHPSSFVPDLDPAIERAILRCLDKDPVRRPRSVAQLAAALPGGDPLAAAIAAGETPSPELVAASGEEGTLPRAQAWTWLAACMAALALAVPLGSLYNLFNAAQLRDPVLLRETARAILRDAGHTTPPADHTWLLTLNWTALQHVIALPPGERRSAARTVFPPVHTFWYRESQTPLFRFSPFGWVDGRAPAPDDDAFVGLYADGRLRTLVIGGLAGRPAAARDEVSEIDWERLFTAAGLGVSGFGSVVPRGTSVFGADTVLEWEGLVDETTYRVTGAAYRGRVTEFLVRPVAPSAPGPSPLRPDAFTRARDLAIAGLIFSSLVVMAIIATFNVRTGRGDWGGAWRIATVIFTAQTAFLLLSRHWTAAPLDLLRVVLLLLGPAFSAAALAWVYYLAVEPSVRRRWPLLLVAWTRLLEGRWRDPLVGRALLAGTTAGLVTAAILPGGLVLAAESAGLPVAPLSLQLPQFHPAWFLASGNDPWIGPLRALVPLAFLLVGRLVFRNDTAAWGLTLLVLVAAYAWSVTAGQPWTVDLLIWAAAVAAINLAVLKRYGLLALAILMSVHTALVNTPLTADLTRWYAWRTLVVAALVAALAVWGFRNVLGRQSALPAGALDD